MHRVFAYGSNMHLPDVRRWLGANGHGAAALCAVERARLPGFELAWNYRSASRRGGAANVVALPGAEVRGVVLHGDDALLDALDEKEGHPTRYDRGDRPVAVERWDGGALTAWLYRVAPSHASLAPVPPRAGYLRLLVEAAVEHELGADYVARLRGVRTGS